MSFDSGPVVSFNIDDSKIAVVTRAQMMSRVALKFLYAVAGMQEPEKMSAGAVKMPDVAEAEKMLHHAIEWLEEIGA